MLIIKLETSYTLLPLYLCSFYLNLIFHFTKLFKYLGTVRCFCCCCCCWRN